MKLAGCVCPGFRPDFGRVAFADGLFYAAFNVKPGAKMFGTPEERAKIW